MPSDSSFTMFFFLLDLLGDVHELSSDLSHDSVVNFCFKASCVIALFRVAVFLQSGMIHH